MKNIFFPKKLIKKPRLILGILFAIICFSLFFFFILKDLPSPNDLVDHRPTLSTKIYDRNGTLLFTFYKDQNRSLVALKDVPDHFKSATLAIEDSSFYNHQGISWKGIFRSIKQIVFSQEFD